MGWETGTGPSGEGGTKAGLQWAVRVVSLPIVHSMAWADAGAASVTDDMFSCSTYVGRSIVANASGFIRLFFDFLLGSGTVVIKGDCATTAAACDVDGFKCWMSWEVCVGPEGFTDEEDEDKGCTKRDVCDEEPRDKHCVHIVPGLFSDKILLHPVDVHTRIFSPGVG